MNEPLTERIERYRPLVLDEMRTVVGSSAQELFAWMRYHLGWEDAFGQAADESPGKLLRSSAVLLAAELTGGSAEAAAPAAAAVELVHNFSLLHDDIEDNSETRRGRKTVWTVAGVPQAINSGDGMFTLARLAMHRLLEAGIEERRVIEAMRELDEACLRLVEGQYLDIAFEQRPVVTRDEYVGMVSGKTGAMFAAPFAIGALLGGAPGESVAAFRLFGLHVGLAFQALDDLLDCWGTREQLGKDPGGDLLSRKKTYPVIAALEVGAVDFARAYAQPPTPGEDIRTLALMVEAAGGRRATAAWVHEQLSAAGAALGPAALGPDSIALLVEFAHSAAAAPA
jgi:geranylgeranyl diphosphate synthase, type I